MQSIFVFGSNLAGKHGKGAAWDAAQYWKADWGVGVGPTGNAYAIPTKDEKLRVLPIWVIQKHISDFVEYARDNPRFEFILTPIGTGLAGYLVEEILDCFDTDNLPDNILFTSSWFKRKWWKNG